MFLPGESQGLGSLVGCRLWGRTESDTTEATWQQQQQQQQQELMSVMLRKLLDPFLLQINFVTWLSFEIHSFVMRCAAVI